MKIETLKVIREGFKPTISTDFSKQDLQTAALNAIKDELGFTEDTSLRAIRGQESKLFAILEEVLQELIPETLQGDFPWAEVKTYGVNDEVLFDVKNIGGRRMHSVIQRGARGGVYRVKKLDGRMMRVETATYGYAVEIDVIDIMTGKVTLQELLAIVTEGFKEKVYIETMNTFLTAKTKAPAANRFSGAFSGSVLDNLVATVDAYGEAVIYGYRKGLANINNVPGWTNTRVGDADLADIRNKGYVGIYKGTKVVELPNYILTQDTAVTANGGGATYLFNANDLIIMPAGNKPVKVAFKGAPYISQSALVAGTGKRIDISQEFGTALLQADNIAIYTIA